MAQFFQPSIQYNDNDPNTGRIAGAIRMSQAGTQPNIGLMHSGVTPVAGATAAQPNQAPGTINYAAGGVVSQGPLGVSVPATPLNVNPCAAANSGPASGGGAGNANLSLISAMSTGDDGPDSTPYSQAPTQGPNIASNAAGAGFGAPQTAPAIGAAQLDNVQFTAAPSGTISSLTLSAAWPRATASNYVLTLSTSQIIYGVTLTQNATTCTFPSTLIAAGANVFAAVAQ
jgi:hypothetical protein